METPKELMKQNEENTNKIEAVKPDLRMTIATLNGPILLIGPEQDLMKFKAQLEEKENRQKFIVCPKHLMTTEPWIKDCSVRPAQITMIVIVNPNELPKKQNLLVPAGGVPGIGRGPMARC